MYVCAKCGGVVEASHRAGDPAVTSSMLGRGMYHLACFREVWREREAQDEARKKASKTKRQEAGRLAYQKRMEATT